MDEAIGKKIEAFFIQYKHQVYKKGEILVRADDDPQGVYYLKSGMVRMYVISQKGEEVVLNIFKPISFFPMTWAINDTPNTYYFEALTDVEVWRAPKNETVAFIKNNSDVLYNLMSRVYRGIEGMMMRMTYLMSGSAQTRLITELLIQAKRFGKKQNGAIELKISEKDIASSSGMTRETVSREIKILKEKGLLTLESGILTVGDMAKLESELFSEN